MQKKCIQPHQKSIFLRTVAKMFYSLISEDFSSFVVAEILIRGQSYNFN